jgi:hypothetical protein
MNLYVYCIQDNKSRSCDSTYNYSPLKPVPKAGDMRSKTAPVATVVLISPACPPIKDNTINPVDSQEMGLAFISLVGWN